MYILGIDTSCDDTSAAVLKDGYTILSNIVSSQTEIHRKYGGIVPELASRKHIEMLWPVVDEALVHSGVALDKIDAIAVCNGPGLIGSLLVGCGFAKAVAFAKKKPLVAVNHLEGHIISTFLEEDRPEFPFLSLVVSGGHTSIYLAEGFGRYTELGRTRDDAAGEAYDKVSKLLGFGYPGGPVIDRLAAGGDPEAVKFPRAYVPDSFDFSFSGLKTAVRNVIHKSRSAEERKYGSQEPEGKKNLSTEAGKQGRAEVRQLQKTAEETKDKEASQFVKDIAASFQASVVEVLVRKMEWAIVKKGVRSITVSGGVAANSALRRKMAEMAAEREVRLYLPSSRLCTDNAAMIAAAGYHHYMAGEMSGLELNPRAYLPLGTQA
jgi:N6-L-threonylcarbamoyladenine synthase